MKGSAMMHKTSVLGFALLLSLFLVGTQLVADQRPGKHKHDDNAPSGAKTEEHGQTMPGHHQHDKWETPPAEYANARSTRWDNAAAARCATAPTARVQGR